MWSAIRFSLKIRSSLWAENTGNDEFLLIGNATSTNFLHVAEDMIKVAIDTWNMCLELHTFRSCAFARYITKVNPALKNSDADWCHIFINALRYSIYHIYIEEYFHFFPREHVFVMRLDYFVTHQMTMLQEKIFPFLNISSSVYPYPSRKYYRITNRNKAVTYEIPKNIYDLIAKFIRPHM